MRSTVLFGVLTIRSLRNSLDSVNLSLIGNSKYAGQREQLSKELDAWLVRTGWSKGDN